MSHDDAAKAQSHSKLVIRNIGLLLSGNMGRPILDADTNRGNRRPIAAIGKTKDVERDLERRSSLAASPKRSLL